MHRTPAARPLLVLVLSAALVLALSACSAGDRHDARQAPTAPATAQSPAVLPSPTAPPALTRDQARAALITEADLGEPWEPTQGAATWRDGLLKATAEHPDCQRLLDALYTEELFDSAPAPRATAALDDGVDGAQLHYRITAHRAADLDRTLAWMGTLPDTCGQFPAETDHGDPLDVQVVGLDVPEAGDARQALRVAVGIEDTVLTMDVVAARLGDDAISLTNGTLGEIAGDATWTALETGARRLTEIRRQGRAQV
ncbi:hypothetical protein H0H10_31835 [Streptomyces sp. TRM S81-3]|uniref:Secreted protein n=1 Tax=Streptomyces griseicoloratus TaxID=2752516 RepID=A0A926LBA8_9ACTN|nr:hypothetical protein [Streptomyces griseicoloratus]MBD0423696.1 hypothetical protein [Streptomyces griseicoloratus]